MLDIKGLDDANSLFDAMQFEEALQAYRFSANTLDDKQLQRSWLNKQVIRSQRLLNIAKVYELLGHRNRGLWFAFKSVLVRPDFYRGYNFLSKSNILLKTSKVWLVLVVDTFTLIYAISRLFTSKRLVSFLKYRQSLNIVKARLYLMEGNYQLAGEVFLKNKALDPKLYRGRVWLAYYYLWSQQYHKAILEYQSLMKSFPESQEYVNGLIRAYCHLGEVSNAHSVFLKFRNTHTINSITKRNLFYLMNEFYLAWQSATENKTSKCLAFFYPTTYVTSLSELNLKKDTTMLNMWGVGDEIRWSSIYLDLVNHVSNLRITCDPRLYKLFSESFKNINFIPCERLFNGELDSNVIKKYDLLPHRGLSTVLDNTTAGSVLEDTQCITVLDVLKDLRQSKHEFSKETVLHSDVFLRQKWRKRLSKFGSNKKVGVCWKSHKQDFVRDIHYFNIELWEKVLAIPQLDFVNLQYAGYHEDLVYIKSKTGRDVIHFDDLDLKNDFDNLAALISELDYVVSPCTVIIELAGALGVPGFMLNNSGEGGWRINADGSDLWYPSIQHICPDTYGKKTQVMNYLEQTLRMV